MTRRKALPATKTRRSVGHPPFEPTDDHRYTVEVMAGAGIVQANIARAIGVSEVTLRKHFRDELDNAKTRLTAKVAQSLVQQALSGNVAACIFWLKTRAGWKEPPRVIEHSRPEAVPIQAEPLSPADLARKVAFTLARREIEAAAEGVKQIESRVE